MCTTASASKSIAIAANAALAMLVCGADLRMLPERGFGVVVLTNGHWHSVSWIVSHAIFDRLLGHDPLP